MFIKKFNYILSNFNLICIGLLNDVFLGNNLGLTSIYFLLFKYLTENIRINIADEKHEDDSDAQRRTQYEDDMVIDNDNMNC